MPSIAVATHYPELIANIKQLAEQLNLPITEMDNQDHDFHLILTPQHLEFRQISEKNTGSIYVDFLNSKAQYRRQQSHQQQELLLRAVKVKGKPRLTIIDATAGLGRDAFVLACRGHQVRLIERAPIIAALLRDGLQRLLAAEPTMTMQLIHQDATAYLAQLPINLKPDVVYLDPMFPDRKKTAAVKKEMQVLQRLLGTDEDSEKLLMLALACAKERVVVKRPRHASPIDGPKPSYTILGKTCRFDIYPSLSKM